MPRARDASGEVQGVTTPRASPKPAASPTLRLPRRTRCAVGAMVLSATGAARGADFGVGAGAFATRVRVDCVTSFPCDSGSAGGKVFAAWRIGPEVDLQASWFDAGRFKGGDTTPLGTEFGGTFKVSGFGLTGGWPAWRAAREAPMAQAVLLASTFRGATRSMRQGMSTSPTPTTTRSARSRPPVSSPRSPSSQGVDRWPRARTRARRPRSTLLGGWHIRHPMSYSGASLR